jgi:hypothetical protein
MIPSTVSAGFRDVGDFPFEAVLMALLRFAARIQAASDLSAFLPLSAGLRGEVGSFEALLLLVPSFAVRTDAAFAISGLLRLRLALNVAVDRRLDSVLLAFLAMDSPVGVVLELSSSKRSDAGASLCLLL